MAEACRVLLKSSGILSTVALLLLKRGKLMHTKLEILMYKAKHTQPLKLPNDHAVYWHSSYPTLPTDLRVLVVAGDLDAKSRNILALLGTWVLYLKHNQDYCQPLNNPVLASSSRQGVT